MMDAARTMMAEFKSLYNFWVEAINTACHASNWLYLCKGLNKTPYEILTGNNPNLKYFRVFGRKCFILKKGIRLSKFEPRLNRAYLLVMLQTLMLIVSSTSPQDSLRRRVTWSLMRITAPKWSKVVLVMQVMKFLPKP